MSNRKSSPLYDILHCQYQHDKLSVPRKETHCNETKYFLLVCDLLCNLRSCSVLKLNYSLLWCPGILQFKNFSPLRYFDIWNDICHPPRYHLHTYRSVIHRVIASALRLPDQFSNIRSETGITSEV